MSTDSVGDDVIVVTSHVSGINHLRRLLGSFGRYDRYPIFIPVNEWRPGIAPLYEALRQEFRHLPLTIFPVYENFYDMGGLYAALRETRYRNFLFLQQSSRIVDTSLFDLVFRTHAGKSVVFSVLSDGFWNAFFAKYRREVLEKIDFTRYLGRDYYDALYRSEIALSRRYHALAPDTVVLFPSWTRTEDYEVVDGRLRMRVANEYIVKWKAHWSDVQVLSDLYRMASPKSRWRNFLLTLMTRIGGAPFLKLKVRLDERRRRLVDAWYERTRRELPPFPPRRPGDIFIVADGEDALRAMEKSWSSRVPGGRFFRIDASKGGHEALVALATHDVTPLAIVVDGAGRVSGSWDLFAMLFPRLMIRGHYVVDWGREEGKRADTEALFQDMIDDTSVPAEAGRDRLENHFFRYLRGVRRAADHTVYAKDVRRLVRGRWIA